MINYNNYLCNSNKGSANIENKFVNNQKKYNYEKDFIFIDIDCDSNGNNGA